MTSAVAYVNGTMYCSKNNDSNIYAHYCSVGVNETVCSDYFNEQVTKVIPGIPGIASGVINCKFMYNVLVLCLSVSFLKC